MKTLARIVYVLLGIGAGLLLYFFYDEQSKEQYVPLNSPLKLESITTGGRLSAKADDVCRMVQGLFPPLDISFTTIANATGQATITGINFPLTGGFSVNIPAGYTGKMGIDSRFVFNNTRNPLAEEIIFGFEFRDTDTTGTVEKIKSNDITYCMTQLENTVTPTYYTISFEENTEHFGYVYQQMLLGAQSGTVLVSIPLTQDDNNTLTNILNSLRFNR